MRRRRGLGTGSLLIRHLASRPAASILVAVIVGIAVLAVVLAPRALTRVADDELHATLAARAPVLADLDGSGELGLGSGLSPSEAVERYGELEDVIAGLPGLLPEPLASAAAGAPQWVSRTLEGEATLPGAPRLRVLADLAVDLRWPDRVRVVAGSAPAVRDAAAAAAGDPLQIAISAATARATGLAVGDVLGYDQGPLQVAEIYEPLDPADRYWAHEPTLAIPNIAPAAGGFPTLLAGFYIATGSAAALSDAFVEGPLDAWMPIDAAAIDYDQADAVATQARTLMTTYAALPYGGYLEYQTGLPDGLGIVVDRVTTTSALLALSLSGLLGVLLAVFALGVRVIITRRAAALSLAAARGASAPQVRGVMTLQAALTSLPASAIGAAVGTLMLPGPVDLAAWILPAILALAPIVLAAAFTAPRGVRRERDDLRMRGRSRVRGVAELAIVGLAAVSLLLLSRRGLAAPAARVGVDPLLSATPLLLALAVCVIVLRTYPLPLLALHRLFRRRDGAIGLLGAARAVRDPALGFAPALALVVGVSVIVFSTVFVGTVRAGLEQSARDLVGADIRVQATALDASGIAAITAIPDVQTVAALGILPSVPFVGTSHERLVGVVVADTVALHAVRPDLPVLDPSAAGPGRVPILVSDDWISVIRPTGLTLGDDGAAVEVAGSVPAGSLPGLARTWLIVDMRSLATLGLTAPTAQEVLVALRPGAGVADAASAIADAVGGSRTDGPADIAVRDVATELSRARTPVIASLENALLLAALVALGLTVLTIVLASVTVAATRNRLIGVLRMLGMSRRQLRAVVAWELGPLAITAAVVGTALGIGLSALVTSVLDLRVFVGGVAPPQPVVHPLWVLTVVGAFGLTVVVAASIAGAVGRRIAPAGAVKMGES